MPSAASPTTVMSGWPPMMTRNPARTNRWSSTTSTEIATSPAYRTACCATVFALSLPSAKRGMRADTFHPWSAVGPASKVPPHRLDSLAHATQPVPAAGVLET